MHIITERRYVEPAPYWLRTFDWRGHRGWGFSFECAENGTPYSPRYDAATENLRKCLDGTYDVEDRGAVRYVARGFWIPAVGRCDCGRKVTLDGFTNTCDCGADYNGNGQRLAPREQWGEETGETAADILGGGDPFDASW